MKRKGLERIVALLLSAIVWAACMASAPDGIVSRFGQAVDESDMEAVVNLYHETVAYYRSDPGAYKRAAAPAPPPDGTQEE